MPNHTTVVLTLSGAQSEINRFINENRDDALGGDNAPLSFERALPTPEAAIGDTSNENPDGTHKMPDWYTWRISNWGTKWDCYDHAPDWENNALLFYTAWSPPSEYLATVSKRYPEVSFEQEFADEGGGFLGSQTFVNGEVTQEEQLGWDSKSGIVLRKKLGCYWEEGELEEDE